MIQALCSDCEQVFKWSQEKNIRSIREARSIAKHMDLGTGFKAMGMDGFYKVPSCTPELCLEDVLKGVRKYSEGSNRWLHFDEKTFNKVYSLYQSSFSLDNVPNEETSFRTVRFLHFPIKGHMCKDCSFFVEGTKGSRPRLSDAPPRGHSCASKRRRSATVLTVPPTIETVPSLDFHDANEFTFTCTNKKVIGQGHMKIEIKCDFSCTTQNAATAHQLGCDLRNRKDLIAKTICGCLEEENLAGAVLSRLLKLAKDKLLSDVHTVATDTMVRSLTKFRIDERKDPFYVSSQFGHRVHRNTTTWNYDSIISLAGSFISQAALERFNSELRKANFRTPPGFMDIHRQERREAKNLLTVRTESFKQAKYLICHFKDSESFNDYLSRVLNNQSLVDKTTSLCLLVDDGLLLTKTIVQFNSRTHAHERFIITGAAKMKESADVYEELIKNSGVLTIAALARILGISFHWSGDLKSLGLLTGTCVQASAPCPLCKADKKFKVCEDGLREIQNFDDFFALKDNAHDLRQIDDWSNPAEIKRLKLKKINPILAEQMSEFGHEFIEDVCVFSPLHFKLSFYRLFKIISAERFILHYKKKKDDKILTAAEKEIVEGCRRIKAILTEIEPLNVYNGAENWTGKQIDSLLAKIPDLMQRMHLLGLRDPLLNEFLRAAHKFETVMFKLMGKELVNGYEECVDDFLVSVVHGIWKRARGGSNVYFHALKHVVKKCKAKGVGLLSLANDQQIENAHQHVKKELMLSRSGKGKKDFQPEDMDKPNQYPDKVSFGCFNFRTKLN